MLQLMAARAAQNHRNASPTFASVVAEDAPLLWYRLNSTAVNGATEPNLGSFTDFPSPDGTFVLMTADQPIQPGAGIVAGDSASLKIATPNSYMVAGGLSGSSLGTTNQYAVESWFKLGATGSEQMIFCMDNTVRTFQLKITSSGLLQITHINGSIEFLQSPGSVLDGNRHQGGAELTPAGDLNLYLDGAIVATVNDTAMIASMKNNACIGNQNGSGNQCNGELSEGILFGTAIGAARFLAHWNAGK